LLQKYGTYFIENNTRIGRPRLSYFRFVRTKQLWVQVLFFHYFVSRHISPALMMLCRCVDITWSVVCLSVCLSVTEHAIQSVAVDNFQLLLW